ncbi:MAG: ATPase domain-containing protein [Nanoarchaeota archaeon]
MVEQIVSKKEDIKRIKTYIEGIDDALEGGIPQGHITLVTGSAGTMKSSVCLNILYNEALQGTTGLYLSLEQSHPSLINHMINMGYDFSKINLVIVKDLSKIHASITEVKQNKTGSLIIVDVGCIRKEIKEVKIDENRSWLNVIKNVVMKIKADTPCKVFVLDSLKALYVLSKFSNPRIELFYIFEYLRDLDLTTYLISEIPPNAEHYGEYDEDFLADGIILLKLTPFRRNIVREISIVKMRTTACNNDVFSLEFKNGRFKALYGGQNPLL